MIYVVSGFMRSGTSMMMHALKIGGLEPAFSKEREGMVTSRVDGNYHPNKNGLYEVNLEDYKSDSFPLNYTGKLIKVLVGGVINMSVHDYHIIVMMRNPEEIRQSYEGFFDRPLSSAFLDNYYVKMEKVVSLLNNRIDVRSCTVFDYRSVVDNPEFHFDILKETGWPIDPKLAAETVDPTQCRFRIENLVEGI